MRNNKETQEEKKHSAIVNLTPSSLYSLNSRYASNFTEHFQSNKPEAYTEYNIWKHITKSGDVRK